MLRPQTLKQVCGEFRPSGRVVAVHGPQHSDKAGLGQVLNGSPAQASPTCGLFIDHALYLVPQLHDPVTVPGLNQRHQLLVAHDTPPSK